jgi:hypothetical protein
VSVVQQEYEELIDALESAVRLAVTALKKNPRKGWRYSPNEVTANTPVSDTVLMGLLATHHA